MKVPPATPAQARDCMVDRPILSKLTRWNTDEKPSMTLSNKGCIASGVTSRPVRPVPPVEMITSIAGSSIHFCAALRIESISSGTIARAASRCPAASTAPTR